MSTGPSAFRPCLRDPIPEIAEAARYVDEAVSAHLVGQSALAEELISRADIPAIRNWTESIWGKKSPYVVYRPIPGAPFCIPKEQRVKERMPTTAEKRYLHQRDGYHCRFCGIPVVRKEVRARIRKVYPHALRWGPRNEDQHAAFQALWVQYDHLLPHAQGGTNDMENIVVTCAPCNFGRMNFTLEEVGLIDPRTREPVRSTWTGLERFR